MSFNYKEFLKEGGIEKYLLEEQFGNDIESRYNFIRPLMSRLPDSARTEAMIDGMEEARDEDDKMAFDFYFVETMKMLGLEDSLMEPDEIGGEVDEINPEDLEAASDYFDNLDENDDVLDEMLDEAMITPDDKVYFRTDTGMEKPMKVIKVRRMFGTNFLAATVVDMDGEVVGEYDETQLVKLEEVEGEVQNENKVLKASNDLEDALNNVVDELSDDQIESITDMILDLRDKVKAQLKKKK